MILLLSREEGAERRAEGAKAEEKYDNILKGRARRQG